MATEVVWLDQALDDLDALAEYLEPLNPRAATAYADAIWNACERLASFPRSGRVFFDEFRMIVVRNHLVFYRYDLHRNQVRIARVLDGVWTIRVSSASRQRLNPIDRSRKQIVFATATVGDIHESSLV